jgi:TolB-like protein/DNA-binding winged helix-turn-helix (wHTH) protein/Flp pilus assembly protein TadD
MKSFQSFRLDPANHCLWHEYERVSIAPKAYDVLRYLVENPDRLVTQDELLEKLWPDTYVNPEVIRKYILEIRRILGDRPDKPEFIETLPKRGYRFVASVKDEDEPSKLSTSHRDEENAIEKEIGPEPARSEKEGLSAKHRWWKLAVVPVLAATAFVAIGAHLRSTRNGALAPSLSNPSVAVLPFVDMSPAKDQEYFSDGLSEQLIHDLARISGLKVVGRSSAFQFKGKNQDLREVGRKLGVANVLEGSVRREGNHLRITAELVKAQDGFELWSQTYDREISDIFAVQDEIARSVAGALQSRLLSAGGATTSEDSRATNSEAYEAYLEGQYFIARGQDKEDLTKALSYADQATKLDPGYAPAWAQRSLVLQTMAAVTLIDNKDGFRRARKSAEKAIALDPELATGYLALAMVQINNDWDWEGASTSVKKASLLAPGSATVVCIQAFLARHLERVEESVVLYKQAIALDPLRANYHLALGDELRTLGRHEEAKAALDKAQELNSQLSSLHLTRAQVLLSEGHHQEAVVEMEKETGDWEKLSGEALAYYAAGRHQESDSALKKLIAIHQNDCAFQIAQVYAFRGEVDKAFEWLDRAYRQRDPGAPEFATDPLMGSLRHDPRFTELLKKMRLPAQ